MNVRKYVYWSLILILSVMLQVTVGWRLSWFPDISLIIVVFAGIFYGYKESAKAGLIVGFLRGIFSAGTLAVDVLLFPLAGLLSALLARMLYRQNPVVQGLITMAAIFSVVVCQIFYLNFTYGNDLNALIVFIRSWPMVSATVLSAPFMFLLFRKVPEE